MHKVVAWEAGKAVAKGVVQEISADLLPIDLVSLFQCVTERVGANHEAAKIIDGLNKDFMFLFNNKCTDPAVADRFNNCYVKLNKLKSADFHDTSNFEELRAIKVELGEAVQDLHTILLKRALTKLNPSIEDLTGEQWYRRGELEYSGCNYALASDYFTKAFLQRDSLAPRHHATCQLYLEKCKIFLAQKPDLLKSMSNLPEGPSSTSTSEPPTQIDHTSESTKATNENSLLAETNVTTPTELQAPINTTPTVENTTSSAADPSLPSAASPTEATSTGSGTPLVHSAPLLVGIVSTSTLHFSYELRGMAANPGNWIGLYIYGCKIASEWITYKYIEKDSGEGTFLNLSDGIYAMKLFAASDKVHPVCVSEPINVGDTFPLDCTLVGRMVKVSWEHVTTPTDWIGLFLKDSDNNDYIVYKMLSECEKTASGGETLLGSLPFSTDLYECRYFRQNSSALMRIVKNPKIVVGKSSSLLSIPSRDELIFDGKITMGSGLKIHWKVSTFEPQKRDQIQIVSSEECLAFKFISPGSIESDYCSGHVHFSSADLSRIPPGKYEVRFYSNLSAISNLIWSKPKPKMVGPLEITGASF
ncbi:hypothetical protein Pelo_53 [Pelomyxa schiedti]|nr:hypothetical protein Pelo_53 [Pelomyxa schiedti]